MRLVPYSKGSRSSLRHFRSIDKTHDKGDANQHTCVNSVHNVEPSDQQMNATSEIDDKKCGYRISYRFCRFVEFSSSLLVPDNSFCFFAVLE